MDIRNKGSLFKLILGILLLTSCNIFAQNTVNKTSLTWQEGYLDIHHINTGRGVASFCILPDGTTMLIDAGDIDDTLSKKSLPLTVTPAYPDNSKTAGEWIVDYINQVLPLGQQNVIDYALITHFHGDHFGVITNKTPIASNGAYKLSGITEVGNLLPIKMLIDRNYPTYNFPIELKKAYQVEPSNFLNLQKFINYQQTNHGMLAASLKVGATNQIVLKKDAQKYPEFRVRGVKANGTIWTGKNDETFDFFTADSVLDAKGKFNENPLSLAIKMSYGKFDYFTGGVGWFIFGLHFLRVFVVKCLHYFTIFLKLLRFKISGKFIF